MKQDANNSALILNHTNKIKLYDATLIKIYRRIYYEFEQYNNQ